MPRPRQPARLWLQPDARDKDGRIIDRAVWVIRDGPKKYRTGCGEGDVEGAQRALQAYLTKRHAKTPLEKGSLAKDVLIADAVRLYVDFKSDTVKRPEELASRAEFLLDWWGTKTLDDISSATCKGYWLARGSQSLARRELEDLRAAINHAIAEKICRETVKVTLPPKPKARSEFLDRGTAAKLIWAAYSKREVQKDEPTKRRPTRHVARFILTALYTGSRSSRVWRASFVQEPGRPYIDLDAGLFYRTWEGEEVASNKRAPSVRLPDRLLAHMRRWRRKGARYVVEYQGRPADPKRAYANLIKEMLGEDSRIVRHTLRHTAATWLMQGGADKYEAAGYLGMSQQVLEDVYGHHHPDHQKGVSDIFTSGRAGRTSPPGQKRTDTPGTNQDLAVSDSNASD